MASKLPPHSNVGSLALAIVAGGLRLRSLNALLLAAHFVRSPATLRKSVGKHFVLVGTLFYMASGRAFSRWLATGHFLACIVLMSKPSVVSQHCWRQSGSRT